FFLPSALKVDGTLATERRRRGLFEAVLYRAQLTLSGTFAPPDLKALGIRPEDVLWEKATLSAGVSDARGVKDASRLLWAEQPISLGPGTAERGVAKPGVSAAVPLSPDASEPTPFTLSLTLAGSESLFVAPAGAVTTVRLSSPWPTPGFGGAFLPDSRDVSAAGFTAAWAVSALGRGTAQEWRSDGGTAGLRREGLEKSAFGVTLVVPADGYQQTTRALKYGILFIALTYLAFFLFEVFGGTRTHPLQLLFVGLALALFYLLLLSLSEHTGFARAYLVAATATVACVGGYAAAILGARGRAAALAAGLLGLYGTLFVLLSLEDYALLLGSIVLFAILASVMYLTRHVDWSAGSFRPVQHPTGGVGMPPAP
ncbi:MAG TPA: cell envelope integrity protein CreD, partial [Thermoanaerobaculia bacterium]|nr:cell envelope integrity protein CreD [Thermoanaerobaculia bacterium]